MKVLCWDSSCRCLAWRDPPLVSLWPCAERAKQSWKPPLFAALPLALIASALLSRTSINPRGVSQSRPTYKPTTEQAAEGKKETPTMNGVVEALHIYDEHK